jgi:hypothetical protein
MLSTAYAGKNPNAVQGLIAMEEGGLKWDDVVTYVSDSRAFSLWGEALNNRKGGSIFSRYGAAKNTSWTIPSTK